MTTEPKRLQQLLIEELGRKNIQDRSLPESITSNLNPRFVVRPYQELAFRFFDSYWENEFEGKPSNNHQLLFHMATGSGKTLLMAGLISYLYDKGYRNFLFFVNSTAVLEKTRANFLDSASSKFLFAKELFIGGERPNVREVDNFQASSLTDINIAFSTIQGLHSSLSSPGENQMTFGDFEDHEIVLISDEAHHINAATKAGAAQEELLEESTWENTVERIARSNPANVLLEFTATVDFADPLLAKKYAPRLLFDYSLREFRKDGYSKEVRVMQADMDPVDRALQAVVLSQYRRKLFEKHKKRVKPVVLFKSKTINESKSFQKDFSSAISSLNAARLKAVSTKSTDVAITRAFSFFSANDVKLGNLAEEIRVDFGEGRTLSVNSKEQAEGEQLLLNTLEDDGNEVRAIFAVDRLNEGWDVLNLFDIVRVYDTRDSKSGRIGKTTMSEAQLIGRGARYFPFSIAEGQSLYQRKFDADTGNEMRVCEELYYHAAHNPKYVQELNSALQEIGMAAKTTTECAIALKNTFKATAVYKSGKVFLNRRVQRSKAGGKGFSEALVSKRHGFSLRTGTSTSTLAFEDETPAETEVATKDLALTDLGRSVLRTAMNRVPFFSFVTLKAHLSDIESLDDLFVEPYFPAIKISVSGSSAEIDTLSSDVRLNVAIDCLDLIEADLRAESVRYAGTKEFYPHAIKSVFTDKVMSLNLDDSSDSEFGKSMAKPGQSAYHLNLAKRAWYVFDDCYGTSEEKALVHFIDKKHVELKKKYNDIFLVRNEKHFQLYDFAEGRALEPDFLLYLIGKKGKDSVHYQVFIEPKGGHLVTADAWKQDFLRSIKAQHKLTQLFKDAKYVAWGLPFFTEATKEKAFVPAFNELLA